MKGFTQKETENLIEEALSAREKGESLSEVFERVAQKTKKAKGSVRNYYYQTVANASKNETLKRKYKDLDKISVKRPEAFTKDEEEVLLSAIKEGRKKGRSVRSIIMELSAGDGRLQLRYQNKYRNIMKKMGGEGFSKKSEDFKYFEKLSKEIDALVDRIKDKYALECLKLKNENDKLLTELNALKNETPSKALKFLLTDKNV